MTADDIGSRVNFDYVPVEVSTPMATNSPILLCGLPRSGTTWIAKMVDSHPGTRYLHEPDKLLPLKFDLPCGPDSVETINRYIDHLQTVFSTSVLKLPVMRKSGSSALGYYSKKGLLFGAKCVASRLGEFDLPGWMQVGDTAELRLAWKSVRLYRHIAAVAQAVPNQRVVFIIRHVGGFMASHVAGRKSGRMSPKSDRGDTFEGFDGLFSDVGATTQIEYGLDRESIARMEPYQRMAWRWAVINHRAIKQLESCPNAMVVSYDAFTRDPMNSARMMLRHLELDWSPEVENFVKESTSGQDDDYYVTTKNPSVTSNKWKSQLPAEEIDWITTNILPTLPGQLFRE